MMRKAQSKAHETKGQLRRELKHGTGVYNP
jgi:hypothetical protein